MTNALAKPANREGFARASEVRQTGYRFNMRREIRRHDWVGIIGEKALRADSVVIDGNAEGPLRQRARPAHRQRKSIVRTLDDLEPAFLEVRD